MPKLRGSMHDKDILEFTIDVRGARIGRAFGSSGGIGSGNFIHAAAPAPQRRDSRLNNDNGTAKSHTP